MIPIRPENRWGERRMLRVRIRRTRPDGTPWPVRPTAEILDDRVLLFEYGWSMDAADPYPGEVAWLLRSDVIRAAGLPDDVPPWIASGDLEPA